MVGETREDGLRHGPLPGRGIPLAHRKQLVPAFSTPSSSIWAPACPPVHETVRAAVVGMVAACVGTG